MKMKVAFWDKWVAKSNSELSLFKRKASGVVSCYFIAFEQGEELERNISINGFLVFVGKNIKRKIT
jgi:hypothetical protein